jgi:FKBP-type peptidyl-prolyl cis-trans isomerase FkpA/FKBP-type peptidyl-prolyl cis-trans isomerase FklB
MAANKSSAGAAAGGLLWWAIAGTALAGIVGATVWLGTRDQVAAVRTADMKYLADNAKKPGVVTTASGLQYQVIREGTGPKPAASDAVLVHYEGRLLDGTVFDSSYQRGQPAAFPLNAVIPGWTEGVQLMATGSKYRFTVPPELAYGSAGAGGVIPPGAVLEFDVELLAVKPQ